MTELPDDKESRVAAYRHLRAASEELDKAARELGVGDVHELSLEGPDMAFDSRLEEDAVKAITNAHSWLNNGQIEGIVREYVDD